MECFNNTRGDYLKHTYVIAEAGVNHNGDVEVAKKMIDAAVYAGVDAVKFQTFNSEKLVTSYAQMATYQKGNTKKEETQYEMLKKLELKYNDFVVLKNYCNESNITFLSTPFDIDSADFLNSIGMDIFKISSGDLITLPLLAHIAKYGKPMIISSGMAVLGEIEEALQCIYNCNNYNVAVLHCTSNYPADFDTVNLNAINTIKNAFNVVTGYSDHTLGIEIPIAATAMGASIIEKHFTLDKSMIGPDHKASLEPEQMKKMVECIRNVDRSMGNGIKRYSDTEVDTIMAARKSIVISRDMKKGEIIKLSDLNFKRPATGISPKLYEVFIGKKLKKDLKLDDQILFDSVDF